MRHVIIIDLFAGSRANSPHTNHSAGLGSGTRHIKYAKSVNWQATAIMRTQHMQELAIIYACEAWSWNFHLEFEQFVSFPHKSKESGLIKA